MDRNAKIAESFLAPVGSAMASRDTRIIERRGWWYQLLTPSSQSTQNNEVVLSRIVDEDVDAVVKRTMAEYAAHRLPFKWCVGPLTEPANMGEVLEGHGFVGWPIRGMAVAPRQWQPSQRSIAVEAVTLKSIEEFIACFVAGWEIPVPDPIAWREDHVRALATGRFHMYMARVDGRAVATAGFIVKPRSIYLVGGNVLPSHRGRGIYRALIDVRLRHAAELGVELATTQAREATSAPILEKLGFETLFRSHVYKRDPS